MSNEERKQDIPEDGIQNESQPTEQQIQDSDKDSEFVEQPVEESDAVEGKVDGSSDDSPDHPDVLSENESLEDDFPEASVGQEIEALSGELEVARRERDDYLDALRRLKAEFENSRKRQERERQRILHAASEKLITDLLPVLDNLDRALDHEGDVREGVRATRDQLADVLSREGLLPVASDGQSFDPNVHEAVMSQPSGDHEEGTIIQTFERGYVLNGKPIRAAKVVVATQG